MSPLKVIKTSLIYSRRFFFYYLANALIFATLSFGLYRNYQQNSQQSELLSFFRNLPYDIIAPKGKSLESLLFVHDLSSSALDQSYIPLNLYKTLKENPQVRLIPILKEGSSKSQITLVSDVAAEDLKTKLAFVQAQFQDVHLIAPENTSVEDPLWGKQITQLILVNGPWKEREQLRDLINKKTVAEYISVADKTDQLMKLLGLTSEKLTANWLSEIVMALAAVILAYLSFSPVWQEVCGVLRRYKKGQIEMLLPLVLPFVILFAALLSAIFFIIPV